jgi:hypothetical protein
LKDRSHFGYPQGWLKSLLVGGQSRSLTTRRQVAGAGDLAPPESVVNRIIFRHFWTNSLLLKMAIEIVDFPIKNGGSFHDFP